jgi:uncharacterized membrane protein YidH (DUF202 family)
MRFNLKKNDETLKISPGITLITLGILINFIAFIFYLNNNNLINKYFTIIIPFSLIIIIIAMPLIISKIINKHN